MTCACLQAAGVRHAVRERLGHGAAHSIAAVWRLQAVRVGATTLSSPDPPHHPTHSIPCCSFGRFNGPEGLRGFSRQKSVVTVCHVITLSRLARFSLSVCCARAGPICGAADTDARAAQVPPARHHRAHAAAAGACSYKSRFFSRVANIHACVRWCVQFKAIYARSTGERLRSAAAFAQMLIGALLKKK